MAANGHESTGSLWEVCKCTGGYKDKTVMPSSVNEGVEEHVHTRTCANTGLLLLYMQMHTRPYLPALQWESACAQECLFT